MEKSSISRGSKKWEEPKKISNLETNSGKCDILKVEENRIFLIGNETRKSLEMTLKQREIEAIQMKASNMRVKTRIEK